MKNDSFKDFALEQLRGVRPLTCQPMFGGHGLSSGGAFFGIIHKGRLFFKVDASTRRLFEEAGTDMFRPSAKQRLSSFYEVPVDVLESDPRITEWAGLAIQSAGRKAKKRRQRSRGSG